MLAGSYHCIDGSESNNAALAFRLAKPQGELGEQEAASHVR